MRALHHVGSTLRGPEKSELSMPGSPHHSVCDLRQVALVSSAVSGSGAAVPVEDTEGLVGVEPSVQHLASMLDHALLGVRCSTVGHSGWRYPAALCWAQGIEVHHLDQGPVCRSSGL